ncbi:MAG: AsmA family protein [Pseudomonadales bacterium]|jgi:uncharacterized protein involved in outer membrane biogenesis
MKRALKIAAVAFVGLIVVIAMALGACLFYPRSIVPVAAWASEYFLDRTLAIEGEVTITLSLAPRISASGIRFGNAAGTTQPHMATAEYAMMQIDLRELLDRRVHLLDLDLRQAELWLEDPVDGAPNWRFGDTDTGPDEGAGWSLLVEGLTINHAAIHAQIGELAPIEIEIPRLTEETGASRNLVLEGEGRLNGEPWQLHGSVGPFDELLAAGRVSLDATMVLSRADLQARGTIGNLGQLTDLDLEVDVQAPDALLLGEIFRMPDVFRKDIALSGRIKPSGDTHRVSVQGHVSGFEIAVSGTLADVAGLDGWDGTFDVSGPDTAVIARAFQITGLPGGAFRIRGGLHRDGGDLDLTGVDITTPHVHGTLAADFLDFPHRQGAVARLTLSGSDISEFRDLLRLPALPSGAPFELDVSLEAADPATLGVKLTVADHHLSATGPLGEYPDFNGTRLVTTLEGSDVSELARIAGLEDAIAHPYQARAVLAIADGALTASEIGVDADPLHVQGNVTLPHFERPGPVGFDGHLTLTDLALAGRHLGVQGLPARRVDADVKGRWQRSGLQLDRSAGQLGDVSFRLSGNLGRLSGPAGIDLDLSASGPDVNELFLRAPPDVSSAIPFELSTRIRGVDDAIDLIGLELSAEGGELMLDGRVSLAEGAVGSRMKVSGHGLHLDRVLPALPRYVPPDRPWRAAGTVSLPAAGKLQIDAAHLEVGSIRLDASGVLDASDQSATSLTLSARGDSIRELGQYGDLVLPPHGFDLVIDLEGSPDTIRISSLAAHLGDSDLQAEGSLDLSGKPRIVLRGESSVLKIDDFQHAIFGNLEDDTGTKRTRLFPDTPINLEELARRDWDVAIDVGNFRGRRASLEDVDLAFTVRDGTLDLERIRYKDDQGSFNAKATIRPLPDQPGQAGLELRLTGENANLGLFVSPDQPPETIPRYDLNVSISGAGSTIAELAGSLNGDVLVSSDGGQINNNLLNTYGGDFLTNVLNVLNPFTKSEPFMPVQCMVLNAGLENGRLTLEPGFVLRTQRLNMFVLGSVDLKAEKLNLSLVTQARRGIGISAATLTNPYFKIGGTLVEPKLELDPQSAALAAGVATATAGLSIIVKGVWSRLMGENNPCPRFLDYQRKDRSKGS